MIDTFMNDNGDTIEVSRPPMIGAFSDKDKNIWARNVEKNLNKRYAGFNQKPNWKKINVSPKIVDDTTKGGKCGGKLTKDERAELANLIQMQERDESLISPQDSFRRVQLEKKANDKDLEIACKKAGVYIDDIYPYGYGGKCGGKVSSWKLDFELKSGTRQYLLDGDFYYNKLGIWKNPNDGKWWVENETFEKTPTGSKNISKNSFLGKFDNFSEAEAKAKKYMQETPKQRASKQGGKCSPSDLKYGTAPDSQFDKSALKAGIKVETEHTNSKSLAKAIAKAHLKEMPDYYKKLKKMEKGGKMSKKDYIQMAKILGESESVTEVHNRYADYAQQDNPRFDRGRFYEAVQNARKR